MVEGIGRPQMEHSFLPDIVDQMIIVPDIASIAAARVLSQRLGKRVGGSTGTNLWACMQVAAEMAQGGQAGSIVSILCDDGARYASTYYNEDWIAARLSGIAAYEARVMAFFETGMFT